MVGPLSQSSPVWFTASADPVAGSTTFASMHGDSIPAVPYLRLSSRLSVEAPIPVDSVSPYPCMIPTHGYFSRKPSITSLLRGAPPESAHRRELKSYLDRIWSAPFTMATKIGGTIGKYVARYFSTEENISWASYLERTITVEPMERIPRAKAARP